MSTEEEADKMSLKGFPLRITYGESTGKFLGKDEFRIGYERPNEVCIVLSTEDGAFPIRYLSNKNDGKIIFRDRQEAVDHLNDCYADLLERYNKGEFD